MGSPAVRQTADNLKFSKSVTEPPNRAAVRVSRRGGAAPMAATRNPCCASERAAAKPAGPVPTTATS
jgi:hypothetical protein